MSDFSAPLSKWFSERPKWLQMAAKHLLEQDSIDIPNLAVLCQQEAKGQLVRSDCTLPANAFDADSSGTIRLCSLDNIEGVNALAPRKSLEFGKSNIAVVYGHNGSGKSGYVRLLKHICGARYLGTLHRNVYTAAPGVQKASITFEKNGTTICHEWAGQGFLDDLRSVDIFDTSFGRVFVNSEDEVSYEPPVLLFFSSLITICEKVSEILDAEAARYPSKKPTISSVLKMTSEGIWFDSVSSKTSSTEVTQHCSFTVANEKELQELQQRLAEQAPSDKAKQLRNQKQYIDSLVEEAEKYLNQLSDDNCRQIIAVKKNAILKKNAAEVAAQQVFIGSHLEGIGSDVWKELWAAARNYSTTLAYRDQDYPHVADDSRCVLCHQTLSPEAKARLLSFEEFVKGEMQRASANAIKEFNTAIQAIKDVPTVDSLKTRADAAGLQQNEITIPLYEFFSGLQKRKEALPDLESDDGLPPITQKPVWIDEARKLSAGCGERAENYGKDAQNENRDGLKVKLNSLLAKKWLSEHRTTAVEQEIERLKLQDLIQAAKKSTNTRSLSQKKGELAEALITDAFVQRFNNELKSLGADRVKVELVKSKVSKGRVLHKLQLRGASDSSLSEVLSEGESRIVSIAAFLADVTGKSNHAPFIFDDPVSSLDQDFEEAVVQRLLGISFDKQVIIFTHRLSLLGTIRHFADKKSIKPDIISIRSTDWGTGEPAPIPLSQSDIKTALNILINQRFPLAKKANDAGEFEMAEIYIKSICSDFRTLVERAIENDLLCGVVQRFQRPVHTLRLKDLAKLKDTDCEKLDSLMTTYSGFEHSQPSESPIELPTPEALLVDLLTLKDWREEYINRPVPPVS